MITIKNKKILLLCGLFSSCLASEKPSVSGVVLKQTIVTVKKVAKCLLWVTAFVGVALLCDYYWATQRTPDTFNEKIDNMAHDAKGVLSGVCDKLSPNFSDGVLSTRSLNKLEEIEWTIEKEMKRMPRVIDNMLSVQVLQRWFPAK